MPAKLSKALPKSEQKRLKQLTEIEAQARAKGFKCIAGVDEAGRGPLAGPVVAAACSIPENVYFQGINDSKLLLAGVRKTLFEKITGHQGVHFGVGIVDHVEIDRVNIFQASLQAMRLAVQQLAIKPDCVLVDGTHTFLTDVYSEAIVNGDRLSQMIAAASILAKVTRDRIMTDYHPLYPEYGFDEHKGYATEKHRAALAKYGPCPIHRRTFNACSVLTNGLSNIIIKENTRI